MKHAGFWRQIFAAIIDQFAIMLPSMIISGIYYYVAAADGVDPALASANADLAVILLVAAISVIYYVYFNGRHGVTLGRLLLHLKLTRLDEPNRDGIGYGRAAVRLLLFAAVGGFVSVSALAGAPAALAVLIDAAFGATILWMLVDRRRRTLEDKIMGTVMVHDPAGKFPAFDPDQLTFAKVRKYSFTALVALNILASVYSVLNR